MTAKASIRKKKTKGGRTVEATEDKQLTTSDEKTTDKSPGPDTTSVKKLKTTQRSKSKTRRKNSRESPSAEALSKEKPKGCASGVIRKSDSNNGPGSKNDQTPRVLCVINAPGKAPQDSKVSRKKKKKGDRTIDVTVDKELTTSDDKTTDTTASPGPDTTSLKKRRDKPKTRRKNSRESPSAEALNSPLPSKPKGCTSGQIRESSSSNDPTKKSSTADVSTDRDDKKKDEEPKQPVIDETAPTVFCMINAPVKPVVDGKVPKSKKKKKKKKDGHTVETSEEKLATTSDEKLSDSRTPSKARDPSDEAHSATGEHPPRALIAPSEPRALIAPNEPIATAVATERPMPPTSTTELTTETGETKVSEFKTTQGNGTAEKSTMSGPGGVKKHVSMYVNKDLLDNADYFAYPGQEPPTK